MPRQTPTRAGKHGSASTLYCTMCLPNVSPAIPDPRNRSRSHAPVPPPVNMPVMPRQAPTSVCLAGPKPVPAPSPLLRYMADHSSRVVAGENVEVLEVRSPGASTYVVSAKTDANVEEELKRLEESVAKQLAEIARIKATMLTVEESEDESGEVDGIKFEQGME